MKNISVMYKRAALSLLSVLLLYSSTASAEGMPGLSNEKPQTLGLLVTSFGKPDVLFSRREISELITFAGKSQIKTLFVQIYKSNLAWFASNVADSSPYKAAVTAVGEDPFALLIREAHREGIEVYAWTNLLSLSNNKNAFLLKKYGPGILTRNKKSKKVIEDYKIDGQYFLEPGDLLVREELSKVVEEIVRAYPQLDGLLFDYIRYPDSDTNCGHTTTNVERFKKATGLAEIDDAGKDWRGWKRDQVTDLLKELVKKARTIRPKIQVATTGCLSYTRALYEAFQNWPMWVNSGLVDSVTAMDYSPDPEEYERRITEIKTKVKDFSKIDITVGAYKPATSLKSFQQEFKTCENSKAGACVLFYYASILQRPLLSKFITDDKR
jgi:uncharacterized lipoprotein YddW (UPF0748 family)